MCCYSKLYCLFRAFVDSNISVVHIYIPMLFDVGYRVVVPEDERQQPKQSVIGRSIWSVRILTHGYWVVLITIWALFCIIILGGRFLLTVLPYVVLYANPSLVEQSTMVVKTIPSFCYWSWNHFGRLLAISCTLVYPYSLWILVWFKNLQKTSSVFMKDSPLKQRALTSGLRSSKRGNRESS